MRYALARQLESLEATVAAGKAAEREANKFRRLLAVLSADDEPTPNVSPIRAIQGAA
jgi:predicted pyridoxine 5'-phosphate oxidase superfamily flavin-nucleotide-binding protein